MMASGSPSVSMQSSRSSSVDNTSLEPSNSGPLFQRSDDELLMDWGGSFDDSDEYNDDDHWYDQYETGDHHHDNHEDGYFEADPYEHFEERFQEFAPRLRVGRRPLPADRVAEPAGEEEAEDNYERELWRREEEDDSDPVVNRHMEALIANATRERDEVFLRMQNFHPFAVDNTPAAGNAVEAAANTGTATTIIATIKAKEGQDECFICLENVPNCKFVGCNHSEASYICAACADRLVKTSQKCPMCRRAVTQYEEVAAAPVKPEQNDEIPDAWDDK